MLRLRSLVKLHLESGLGWCCSNCSTAGRRTDQHSLGEAIILVRSSTYLDGKGAGGIKYSKHSLKILQNYITECIKSAWTSELSLCFRFLEMFLCAYAPVVTAGPNLISGTIVTGSDLDVKQVPQGWETYLPYYIMQEYITPIF